MRLDYTLYVLAALLFLATIVSLVTPLIAEAERNLWIVITVVLGLLSIGLGYSQRPKTEAQACQPAVEIPQTTVPQQPQPITEGFHEKEAYRAEKPEAIVETPPIMPQSTTPIPAPVIAPMPVFTPTAEARTTPKLELTEVKGIGEKRAVQLEAIGISNIDDLAEASAEDIAKKLQISLKITRKWIDSAKKLAK